MDLGSSLAVIGWFVQVLFDKGMTFAIDHWGGAGAGPDFLAALERLREELNNVRVLLPVAQKIRSENEGLLESVKDLKDAVYDAEDILSELEYYRLQEEVEGNENSNNSSFASSMIEAAGGFLSQLRLTNEDSQASTSSPPPSLVDGKVTIIPRINKIVARLERIFDKLSRLLPLLKSEEEDSHVSPGDRVTTSFVSSKQTMFGREETKAQIIDLLLNGQPTAASDVYVLPIIGAGGIGKTTLARAVYNDKQVVEHFDCRIWLYVSGNFDVLRLTRDMLESLGDQRSNNTTHLDQLQRLLKEDLCSKKFLLVLDDVWNDTDSGKWDMLCGPLQFGKPGSRILLTTRLDTVVSTVDRSIDVLDRSFKLTGLPMRELLSLFNKCAFGNEEPSDHPYLAEIGKQIAGKLGGSPLAAKTVGSLLNENLDVEHWRRILSSDIWRLPQRHDDIMPVLKLSYQHLPVHLQLCFAYCCVFPKGRLVDKRGLVRMWIANGYIDSKTSGTKSMEDIGREYFKTLLARSFFEDIVWYSNVYGVHDLFHDLAQSISADECFLIDTNNKTVPRRVRHLSLDSDDMALVLQKSYLSNLRTLIVATHMQFDAKLFTKLLNGLKSVRVICILKSNLQQLPRNMEHLIHLRYLCVDGWSFECRVPDSLGRLYQLQYVLNASKSITFRWPKILTRLHRLYCFFIEEGRKIGELKNLNQLGGYLALQNLENVHTKDEALEAELSKKVHIRTLSLECKDSQTSPEVAEEVFEGLRPPAYIKKLHIAGYRGVNSPKWMVHEIQCFSNLKTLYLENCLKWKVLPPLGQLPSLKQLYICRAFAVEVIGREFYGTGDVKDFPCLETLEFSSGLKLVVWSGTEEDPCFSFPRLRKLDITGCPKLEQVPKIDLTSLTELATCYMPLLVHPENLSSLKTLTISKCEELQFLPVLPSSLEELEIKNCPQLLTLFTTEQAKTMSELRSLRIINCPRLMSAELKSLPSLKEVQIRSCNRLPSLPLLPATLEVLEFQNLEWLTDLNMEQEEKLSDLTSLRRLAIAACPHLNSLPLLPASLEILKIHRCPELPRERYQEGGDEWNKLSHIPRIELYQNSKMMPILKVERLRQQSRFQSWLARANVPARK